MTLELVDPKDIIVPSKPWAETAEAAWGWDFVACLEYNPPAEFVASDVATAIVLKSEKDGNPMELGEGEYEWRITLGDGREFLIVAGHDYTGWDCQSWAEYTPIAPDATR